MANLNEINFACSNCHEVVSASSSSAGQQVCCQNCAHLQIVPVKSIAAADSNAIILDPLTGNPVASDNSTIKIDGVESPQDGVEIAGVKCHVCDTRILVNADQVGKDVECPDCFTMVPVVQTAWPKKKKDQNWKKIQAKKSDIRAANEDDGAEYQLSAPVERPKVDVSIDNTGTPEVVEIDANEVAPGEVLELEIIEELEVIEDAKDELPTFHVPGISDEPPAPEPVLNLDSQVKQPGESLAEENEFGIENENLPSINDFPNAWAKPKHNTSSQSNDAESKAARPTDSSARAKSPSPKSDAPEKSRRELYEESQSRRKENYRKNSTPFAPSRSQDDDDDVPEEDPDFLPDFDFGSLNSAVMGMLRSPGLLVRLLVVIVLMGVGYGIMHVFNNAYDALPEDKTMGDWFKNTALWFGLGVAPYLLGTIVFWYLCGCVFRDAARGYRQVAKWGFNGLTEFWSTFFIFAFSFLIAGLPVGLFPVLVTPFRFLLAPPLLFSAWFNQHPFAIASVDAFQTVGKDASHWKELYKYIAALVGISIIASMLMLVSIFILANICSLLGVAIMAPLTIAFAAVNGWHCRRITLGLEKDS